MPTKWASFVVPPDEPRQRLDHFLATRLPELSRSRLQKLIRQGGARVDDRVERRPGLRLQGSERLRLEITEPPPLRAIPEALPLHILYEDEDVVAIDKPAGMVVHAGAGQSRGTVVNALLHHFKGLSQVGGALRPGIVHRLDKQTSGVLLVAKTDEAHRHLAEQFRERHVEKHYIALVHGTLKRGRATISLPVARDRVRRTRMTTRRRHGRAAITVYRVRQTTNGFTLVEATLHTGRTHQLRVHFSALGCPVVGDTLYGAPRRLRWRNLSRPTLSRNFLHAERLRFQHPRTNDPVEVISSLPAELAGLLQQLGFKASVSN